MQDQKTTTKKLISDIQASWTRLNDAIGRLTEQQLTELKDAQSWTVKDHLIHMTAWERSVIFFLQKQPRYLGLGVDQSIYSNSSTDAINRVIFEERKELPLGEVLERFRDVHHQLSLLLEALEDSDLYKTYQHFLPEETNDKRSVLEVISSNTVTHFKEHQTWIENIVQKADLL